MKAFAIFGLASILVIAVPANSSGFYKGVRLLSYCTVVPDEHVGEHFFTSCRAYISAIADAISCTHGVGGFTASFPEGTSDEQLEGIVIKWLKAHPEKLHFAASGLVAAAFEEAFPCP